MDQVIKQFAENSNYKLYSIIMVAAVVLGVVTGYALASSSSKNPTTGGLLSSNQGSQVQTAAQKDSSTFKDFAEGVIQPKPSPKSGADYSEGAFILVRQNAVPVALTSSVVDLSKYTGKKVKVYGETQKAIKEGWLMDVGRVDAQ
jgi:hypothetical protein